MSRACQDFPNKRRFRDKAEAVAALHRLAKSDRNKVPDRAYFCSNCNGYHLTSKPDKYAISVDDLGSKWLRDELVHEEREQFFGGEAA